MHNSAAAAGPGAEPNDKPPAWLLRTIAGAVAAVVLVAGYLFASVAVPLMWANSIRDQIGGQLGNSIPLGMFYGFVFIFVPILVAWQAHRKKFNKWVRISFVVLGLLLTIPNLLTLGVLHGSSQSAFEARAIWSSSANWFGTWSQVFMVVGVVCAVALIVLGRLWLRRGKKMRKIKAAEKLARENEAAKQRAAKVSARQAEKTSKAGSRASRHSPSTGTGNTPEA